MEEARGRQTIEAYVAQLPADKQHWKDCRASVKQVGYIIGLAREYGLQLIQRDLSVAEASMLIDWLKDYDNLDKKPYFNHSYLLEPADR